MSDNFKKLEKEVLALSPRQKAELLNALIDDLDTLSTPGVEQAWVAEAQRRYQAYLSGEVKAVPGEEAMQKARRLLS